MVDEPCSGILRKTVEHWGTPCNTRAKSYTGAHQETLENSADNRGTWKKRVALSEAEEPWTSSQKQGSNHNSLKLFGDK